MTAELEVERQRLVAEIHEAFAGVTRDGGVSWSESEVVDDCGSDEERASARARDLDRSWEELLIDEKWNASTGTGGWSFLDAIGFRYYLPAGMIQELSGDGVDGFPFQLTLGRFFLRDHTLQTWSLLSERQKQCVGHFILFVASEHQNSGYEYGRRQWMKAYDSFWKQFG